MEKIVPVVLSGGSGTRLWPRSRSGYPKQFLPLMGAESLLVATCRRVSDPERFARPLLLCNVEHRFVAAEQLREAGIIPQAIILEPVGRGTAAAIAVAALFVARTEPGAVMLVLAADSHIEQPDIFLAAVATAEEAAKTGRLAMFGITPVRPETGYGYIRQGALLNGVPGVYRVDAFLEKPDLSTAEAYVAARNYLWNSGNFMFRADALLSELERLEPTILDACRNALAFSKSNLDFLLLDREALAEAPAKSIDYAVMEHTDHAAVVPSDMGWSDIGSWDTLWRVSPRDSEGNVLSGDVVVQDVRDSYLHGDGRMIAAIGLEDIVVIETDDVVFVAPRCRAAEVKGLVDRLKVTGRSETDSHTTTYQPWGSSRSVDHGDRFRVKRIVVRPGGHLSARMHNHRTEHWVVVHGTARVTFGEKTTLLHENESVFIPVGTVHRLENPGPLPLHLIEIQIGAYLGEGDIARSDDDYGRTSGDAL